MKTIEISKDSGPLAEAAREVGREPIILTRAGEPYAAIISYEELEWLQRDRASGHDALVPEAGETLRSYLRRVRARYDVEGGIPLEEIERKYGLTEQDA